MAWQCVAFSSGESHRSQTCGLKHVAHKLPLTITHHNQQRHRMAFGMHYRFRLLPPPPPEFHIHLILFYVLETSERENTSTNMVH